MSSERAAGRPAPGVARWAALLAALACVPAWRVLILGETFWFRDIHLHYLPHVDLASSILRGGRLPTWDPFLHGGSPLWANPNTGVLHPATLLSLLVDPPLAFGLGTSIFLALAGLGTFGLMRRLGGSPPAAFLAGAAAMLSGSLLSLINLHPLFLGTALVPVMAWAWDGWLCGLGTSRLAVLSVAAAGAVVAGTPEACLVAAVTLGAWTLVRGTRPAPMRALGLGIATTLTALLSAPAWLPAVELLRSSPRGAGLVWKEALAWSLPPLRLPELAVPGLLGNPTALDPDAAWGRAMTGHEWPYLIGISVGPLVLALAIVGALRASCSRGVRLVLAGLVIAALVIAMAGALPGAAALLEATGMRPPVRYPEKALACTVLPIALLAGAGLDALDRRAARRLAAILGASAAGLVAVAIAVGAGSIQPLLDAVFGADSARAAAGLPLVLGMAAAHAALGAAGALTMRDGSGRAILALLAAASLLAAGLPLNPSSARDIPFPVPRLLEPVREAAGDGRLFRWGHAVPLADPRLGDGAWSAWMNAAVLRNYQATRYGIPVALHVDPDGLAPERAAYLQRGLPSLSWRERAPILSAAGVTAVLTDEPVDAPGFVEVPIAGMTPDDELRLYRHADAADGARFVSSARAIPDVPGTLRALTDPQHDPRHEVILLGSGEAVAAACEGSVQPRAIAPAPGQRLTVEAGCDGFLVLSIPYQLGLSASVDGRPVPLLTAELAYCAVGVPAGTHVVEWRYRPPGLAAGGALHAVGLAALAALVLMGIVGRRRGLSGSARRVTGIERDA